VILFPRRFVHFNEKSSSEIFSSVNINIALKKKKKRRKEKKKERKTEEC